MCGNNENDKTQTSINHLQTELLKARVDFASKNKTLLKDLSSKKSNYFMAEKFIIRLLQSESMAISIGCLSAKDRTGLIGHLVIQYFVTQYMKAKNLLEKNPFGPFDPNSMATQVLLENTPDYGALKVDITQNITGVGLFDKASHAKNLASAEVKKRWNNVFKKVRPGINA